MHNISVKEWIMANSFPQFCAGNVPHAVKVFCKISKFNFLTTSHYIHVQRETSTYDNLYFALYRFSNWYHLY